MMIKKKTLAVAALSILTVGPANATIARLQALGMNETDNEGSYYIQDDRNIFLNVANIHNYANTVILEWGSDGKDFGGNDLQTDETSDPKAKGGIIKSHGDFVYGVYLGNESNTSSLLKGVATGAYASLESPGQPLAGSDNQIDLFFGGKASAFKWAVNAVYTSDYRQGTSRDRGSAIRFGMIADKWDFLLNLSTSSKSNKQHVLSGAVATANGVNGQKAVYTFDGSMGFHLGGGYQVTDTGRIYAFAKKFDWDQFDSIGTVGAGVPAHQGRGQQGVVEGGFLTYAVGYGSEYSHGAGTLYTNIEYRHKSIEVDFTTKAEAKNVILPVTVGYEYKATNWLALRGSVIQNIYGYKENNHYEKLNAYGENAANAQFGGDTDGGKVSLSNTTDVRAGATLAFGNLKVDGLIGLGSTNGTIGTAERGVLDMDRLLARVGMVYSF